eukprot:SAG31_NODE_6308_length_2072_cov_1.463254_4_plen_144_part_00
MDYDPAMNEQYRNNTCVLRGATHHWWCNGTSGCGVISVRGCLPNAADPKAQSLLASDNTYWVPRGGTRADAAVYWDGDDNRGPRQPGKKPDVCEVGGSQTIAAMQVMGAEARTRVKDSTTLSAAAIVSLGEALLARANIAMHS